VVKLEGGPSEVRSGGPGYVRWWKLQQNESEIHGGKGIEEFPANCQRYLGTCGGRDLAGKDPPPASHGHLAV